MDNGIINNACPIFHSGGNNVLGWKSTQNCNRLYENWKGAWNEKIINYPL